MQKQVKRSVNWEQEEKDLLSNLVLERVEVIENPRIDTNTNRKKKDAWSSIHTLFNNVSKTPRTLEQIQNQWRKTKSLAKAKNSPFVRQAKQTGRSTPAENLAIVEEELICPLPQHLLIHTNGCNSNSLDTTDEPAHQSQIRQEINEEQDSKTGIRRKSDNETENSKRIKLLDISIKQKEMEIKIMMENHIIEKRKSEIIESQLKEEHNLKVEKLKLEIEKLRKEGHFSDF